ncbi:MAG: ribonuclease HI [Chthoniobacteraceae bacterium]
MSDSAFEVVIHTDGACEGNPGPGGWAAVLTSGAHRKVISGGYRRTTNNRMELRAVIEALAALKGESRRVKVVSDSRYVTDAVNKRWLANWVRVGFRKTGGVRENADLWIELHALLQRHSVKFEWIRGHNAHAANEECDLLAVAARRGKELLVDAAFENPASSHAALGLTLV